MAIDGQIVVMRPPTGDGTGTPVSEVENQQLNDALASGTVGSILMSSTYDMTDNNHVATKKYLAGYAQYNDIQNLINDSDLDFKWYDSSKTLEIKANQNYPISAVKPSNTQLDVAEIAVDNNDGSIWTRRYAAWSDGVAPGVSGIVSRINAGAVNGVVIDPLDYFSKSDVESYVVNKINEAFSYNSATNARTIKRVAV